MDRDLAGGPELTFGLDDAGFWGDGIASTGASFPRVSGRMLGRLFDAAGVAARPFTDPYCLPVLQWPP